MRKIEKLMGLAELSAYERTCDEAGHNLEKLAKVC